MNYSEFEGITLLKKVEMSVYWDKRDFDNEQEWFDLLDDVHSGDPERVDKWYQDGEPDCGDGSVDDFPTIVQIHKKDEQQPIIINDPIEMCPQKPEYWAGQKVTLPQMPSYEDWSGGDISGPLTPEQYDQVLAMVGKKVLIHSVELDVDGTAPCAYYNFKLPNGIMWDMNFNIFPIEMAREFGFAGWTHFGERITLPKYMK